MSVGGQTRHHVDHKIGYTPIDQEGGQICRLKEVFGFPSTRSAQYLGTINDLSLNREHATAMAQTLGKLGVNVTLAPVHTYSTNHRPEQAFFKTTEDFTENPLHIRRCV